jgi:inner membrane transporter RhtA
MFTPVGVYIILDRPLMAGALACAATAGLLSSAVPLLADLLALRRVPARFFGLFMSVNPVFAAALGVLVLHQNLQWTEWAAITAIVAANAVSIFNTR